MHGYPAISPEDIRTPVPDSDIERFGKFSVAIAPPRVSNITDVVNPPEQSPQTFLGTDQKFVSQVLGGLTSLVTGVLPGFIRDPIVNVASGVGTILDIPVEAAGHVPLPWVPSTEEAFEKLPMTQEKARILESIRTDPLNLEWYMSQYVRSHQGDLAAAMEVPQALAPLIVPDSTLLERALMTLSIPQMLVERTYAGGFNRIEDVMAAPKGSLHPEIEAIRERYAAGEYGQGEAARDRFLDEIVRMGAGFTNDPFVNMVFEVFTDPIIVAGFGTGLAANAAKAGAIARRVELLSRAAIGSTDNVVKAAWSAAELAEEAGSIVRRGAPKGTAQSRMVSAFMQNPAPEVQSLVRDVTSTMSRSDRAKIGLTPVINGAAKVSEMLNSPLGIFGRDNIGKVFGQRFANKAVLGFINGHDILVVHRLSEAISALGPDVVSRYHDALGRAVAYSQRSLLMDNLSKMARVWGKGESASFMPDAISPSEVARQIEQGYRDGVLDDSLLAQEVQRHTERVRYQPVPDLHGLEGDARRVEYDRQMGLFREQAAEQLAYVLEIDVATARRMVGDASEDTISYIHNLHWGRVTRDFVEARNVDARVADGSISAAQAVLGRARIDRTRAKAKKRLIERQADRSNVQRVTIVGPRTLTIQDAERILKDIGSGSTAAVQDAVAHYEELARNFYSPVYDATDVDFLNRVKVFLEDAIKNQSLVSVISDDKLRAIAPTVAQYLDDSAGRLGGRGYRVGLAPSPDKVWRAVTDEHGNLVGYAPWMDIDVTPGNVATPTRMDVIRQKMFSPIRAENILQRNRREFIRSGVRDFGLDHGSAATLWNVIRKAASDREMTMRAFTRAELGDLLNKADIPRDLKTRIGDRGYMLLVARAMEGDVMQVGLTSKMTGALKTQTTAWQNYVSMLAERVYPWIRFNLNPIFLAQEFIEPYFYNILRGYKLGRKLKEQDVEHLMVIEAMNSSLHLAEGLENREFRTIGAHLMHRYAGPQTFLGGLTAKLSAGTSSLRDVKSLNYVLAHRKQYAEAVVDMWDRVSPTFYARVSAHFNDLARAAGENVPLSREEVVVRWLKHKGWRDPDRAETHLHLWDGGKPDTIGRIDGVRRSHVARWAGYDSWVSMRADIAAGGLDEWTFRNGMVSEGLTPEYAERAWQVANAPDIDQFLDDAVVDYDPAVRGQARETLRAMMEAGAVTQGIPLDEYVARTFTGSTQWLDNNGQLPIGSYLQVFDRWAEEYGIELFGPEDARWQATLARANDLLPSKPHKDMTAHVNAGNKALAGKLKTKPVFVGEVEGVKFAPDHGMDPVRGAEEYKRYLLSVLTAPEIEGAAGWYRMMGPRFASVFHAMDDESLRRWAKLMNAHRSSLPEIDLTDMAAVRVEVSARAFMAWAATQVQTSPRGGLGNLVQVIDETIRPGRQGKRPKVTFYKMQEKQMRGLIQHLETTLSSEGVAAKLYDFMDSVLGNEQRSWFKHHPNAPTFTRLDGTVVPMQPAAIDVWMKRDRGYIDSETIRFIAQKRAEAQSALPYRQAYEQELVRAQIELRAFEGKQITVEEVQPDGSIAKKKKDEPKERYYERKRAFEQEHGVELNDVYDKQPETPEYAASILRYNELTDAINQGEGWLGRSYANGNPWTVADIQAVAWEAMRRQYRAMESGPMAMFPQTGAQVAFEAVPSTSNRPFSEAFPFHGLDFDTQDIITGDMAKATLPIVSELTGVTITAVAPGRGGWKSPDGFSHTPNTAWELFGSAEQVDDARLCLTYLLQQDCVFSVSVPKPKVNGQPQTRSGRGRYWAFDFKMDGGGAQSADVLARYLHQHGIQWNGYMAAFDEQGNVGVRSLFTPRDEWSAENHIHVPDKSELADFEAMAPVPAELLSRLQDGTWIQELGGETPVPVRFERNLYDSNGTFASFSDDMDRVDARVAEGVSREVALREELGKSILDELTARGRGDVAAALADRHLGTVIAAGDDAFKRAAPDVWARERGIESLKAAFPSGAADAEVAAAQRVLLQRRGRGWAGATAFDADSRATFYLNRQKADLTTLVHESFHTFARNLQPSAIEAIHDIYAAARRKPRPTTKTLSRDAEEWVAAQYENYVAKGFVEDPSLRLPHILNAYADWGRRVGRTTGQFDPRLQSLFDSVTPEVHGRNMSVWDPQQFMLAEAARIAWSASEEAAFKTHYYARGRSWLERSANHPYLGLYPLSYMWGKVLPELMRFLIEKPFGVDAPFAGLAMANHVWEAIQLELNTDDGIADFVAQMPETLHLLELMLPGTPWNLPVNMPAWTRRLGAAALQGDEVTLGSIGSALTDTFAYAFGPGRAPRDVLRLADELTEAMSGQQAPIAPPSGMTPPTGVQ
jgi:hypothetical protein